MPAPTKRTFATAMILAPLLLLVSVIVAPPQKSSEATKLAEIALHRDRWYLYAVFGIVGAWFLVPAVLGLMRIVSGRSPRLSAVGGTLAMLGVLIAIGDATAELLFWQMGAPGADRTQMVALANRYDNATGSSLLFAVGGLALLIGLGLLAFGLWRSGVAAWAAAGIPVGMIVNIAGFSAGSTALLIASNVILLVAFGWVARFVLAEPTTSREKTRELGAARPARSAPRSA